MLSMRMAQRRTYLTCQRKSHKQLMTISQSWKIKMVYDEETEAHYCDGCNEELNKEEIEENKGADWDLCYPCMKGNR